MIGSGRGSETEEGFEPRHQIAPGPLGIEALAVVDRNSLAGIVRAHEAAKVTGVRLIVGCRLDLRDGMSLLVYSTDRPAYARLCRLLSLGKKRVRWLDAAHVPHGWDCGYMFETTTSTLLCGDLFTQAGGAELPPLTDGDILGPSEIMRRGMDYYSHGKSTRSVLEKLAATKPRTLALMHGSSFAGDGEKALLELANALGV